MTNKFVHDKLPQGFYDSFNEFIFSSDRNVIGKLFSKYMFCQMTDSLPGDVVELGVFKGSGMFAWIKALECFVNNKRVYGFDIFDADRLVESTKTDDSQLMKSLFVDRNFDPRGYIDILVKLFQQANILHDQYELVQGDVIETAPLFLSERPGFRASIVNFDLDLEEPTAVCLDCFWEHLVPGGIMVFDEYAVNEWTESNAVDRFILNKGIALKRTPFSVPTAYIVKPRAM